MIEQTTIARPEIAKLMGISKSTLAKVLINPAAKAPKPLLKSGQQLVYDRKITLAWIATKPLEKITWQQRVKKPPVPEHVAQLDRAFLTGHIGISRTQRNRIELNKLAAKHAPSSTQRVELDGSDDYHGSRDSWAGLV